MKKLIRLLSILIGTFILSCIQPKDNIIKNKLNSMKIKLTLISILILFTVASCSNKDEKKHIPNDAFPIVYRGHIYVQGEADTCKGNFVFDTGASNFYYDSTYYAGNNYHYTNFFTAKLPGAGTSVQTVEVIRDTVSFRFGDNLYQTKIVPILKLKPILGDFADGILGMEYFYGSVLEINYEHEYMRRFQNIDSVDVSTYTRIKLEKEGNRLFIPLKVQINDSISIEGNYQLDFGAGGNAALTSSAANEYNLLENIEEKIPYYTKYGGVGGESSSYWFRASSLQIADFVFDNVSISFSADKSGAMASNKHFGLLGNGIYERFNVIIDFTSNDFYIKPNSNFKDTFEFSKLGFSYVDRNQTMNAWIVTGLYSGCDAEKQGLKIDDKIIAVNGIDIHEISYESQKDFFEKSSKVTLTIRRADKTIDIQFKIESIG